MSSKFNLVSCLTVLATGAAVLTGTAQAADVPKELADRMAKEKADRKACKIEICKAFAAPTTGDDIKCSITKTWLRDEILAKVVGGSWVWGYGNTQCVVNANIKRAPLNKAIADATATVAIGPHTFSCNVDKKDGSGKDFSVEVNFDPTVEFKDGKAVSVNLGNVTTKGSTAASAAVTSVLAVDKVSGVASRAVAGELNTFLYNKCKDDGVVVGK